MAGARVRISLVAAARLVRLVQSRGAGLSGIRDPLRSILRHGPRRSLCGELFIYSAVPTINVWRGVG